MADPKVKPILFDSYLSVIKNSLGSNMFKNFYAEVDGKYQDVLRNGELSCAYFVSAILHLFELIKEPHRTVDNTVEDMKKSGWQKIAKPRVGTVLVYEEIKYSDSEKHQHIGFYIGNDQAISNTTSQRIPASHHWTFGGTKVKPSRKVTGIYWNKKLRP